jgi:hypothetical protein
VIRESGSVALSFVSHSHTSLTLTLKNVVIVVISLQQRNLRMTTFSTPRSHSNELSSPSTLANDDAFLRTCGSEPRGHGPLERP